MSERLIDFERLVAPVRVQFLDHAPHLFCGAQLRSLDIALEVPLGNDLETVAVCDGLLRTFGEDHALGAPEQPCSVAGCFDGHMVGRVGLELP